MDFVEDRSVFFGLDGPGNVAGIVNGTFPLQGAFFGEYVSPYGVVEANAAVLACDEAVLPYVAQGDRLVIGQQHYTIVNIKRDGTGVVRLVLNEA